MAITKRRRFVHAHIAWMLGSALVLVLLDALTYELFFVVSLVGFLIVVEVTAPIRVTPGWRRRLRWVIVAGFLGFSYLIFQQMLEILPSGVL